MGASTTAQLINLARAENGYNNSGISSDGQWVSFFNDALRDLVDDLKIERLSTISFTAGTREYDLPSDYYALVILNDGNSTRVDKRRHYDQQYPQGYWIFNRGGEYIIDFYGYSSTQTFTLMYQAYPTVLTEAGKSTERPEVPSVGEKALIYYAIMKALRNNSQSEWKDYAALYEEERKKIRNAVARGGG